MSCVLLLVMAATLADLQNEPNLEKRAKLALEYAEESLADARAAYNKGDLPQTTARLDQVRQSVDLAQSSLQQTGKDARRRSRPFKFGEGRTRVLLRQIDSFENAMNFDDRPLIEPVKARVEQVHEAWLLGIMGEKGNPDHK